MLADAAAPAVLAGAPRAVMLADAGAPAVRAPAPVAVMLADAGASAVLHLLLSRLSSDFCVPSEERSLAASASFLPARPPPPPARPHHRPAAPPCCHQPVPRQEERGSRLHDSFLKLLANAIRRCAYCVQRQRDQRDPLVYAQRNALVFRSTAVQRLLNQVPINNIIPPFSSMPASGLRLVMMMSFICSCFFPHLQIFLLHACRDDLARRIVGLPK